MHTACHIKAQVIHCSENAHTEFYRDTKDFSSPRKAAGEGIQTLWHRLLFNSYAKAAQVLVYEMLGGLGRLSSESWSYSG